MRGQTAKRLRAIARGLSLEPKTSYVPGGKLRRRPSYRDAEGALQQGAPIRRPWAMVECFRRAYKEAKKIYKGLPLSTCVPEVADQQAAPFHVRVVDSMKAYNAQN
jgi:hypothetical protein